MHKLLSTQLRKHFGLRDEAALEQLLGPLEGRGEGPSPQAVRAFLAQVDATYAQFDRDIGLAHRGLVLSNQELASLYERQRQELERQERALAALREGAKALAGEEVAEGAEDDLEALSGLVSRLVKERETAREALLQAQKLESLGVMAGGIAHDFNNLLVAIAGNLEMALLHLEPGHPARTYLERMGPAAARSADIIRQLLDYAGKGRLQFKPLDLNALVREVESLLPPGAWKGVALERALSPEPLPLQGDGAQLIQAILNLVVNALDAMSGEGTLSLRTEAVRLTEGALGTCPVAEGPPGTYAALHVRDTGCGVDDEHLARIFDPFFSTKAPGRGLGLAVVHGVLRNHLGAAKIQSTPGRGTTVTLYLPLSEALLEPAPAVVPAAPREGPFRILVVDDEAPNRMVVGAFLDSLGHAFGEASSGTEALRLQAETPYDALLLDLSMPGLDGIETLQRLRQSGSDVPVILMSGYSEALSKPRLEGLRFSAFLQKPFRLTDLGEALARALAR